MRLSLHLLCAVIALLIAAAGRTANSADDDAAFFEKRIRPLLLERCEGCHSARKKASGGLALDTREGWKAGGDSGPVIVPGKPDESYLIRAVRYDKDGPRMPPAEKGGQLPETEIAALVEWVRRGAPDPRTAAERIGVVSAEAARNWWAFRPLKPAAPPDVRDASWAANPIDRFVLAELEKRGLDHAPPADRRTWLRRATFGLTGLPPTPEEVDAFLADDSDDAFERVVERLLASPAFGPRWARHWLDVARYADYHDGNPKARTASCEPLNAWRYRDWVVNSFNRDLPFNQFIIHQIAGDLLADPDGKDFYADGLVATTFLTNGVWDRGDADKEKMVSDMVDDNVDTIGRAFLGLTLGCARCHDHKFDPVTQRDYYGLAGIFYSTRILKDIGTKGGEYTLNRIPLVDKGTVARREAQLKQIAEVQAKLSELDKKTPKTAEDDPERKELAARRAALQSELLPEPPVAEAVSEGGTTGGLFPGIQDVPIHIRGSYTRLGPIVPRRLPEFLAGPNQAPISQGSGRREVAAWVASRENPLTARVLVNRVWQGHFGTGLVSTPNNFGLRSEAPSHPELLDWLAARFVEDGWSLKSLHRWIVLSATYRQSSSATRQQLAVDPDNRWLGRFTPRRLEAEEIRDAMLSVAGQLDATPGGPATHDLSVPRRSLYVQTARWDRGSFALLFDAANPDSSDERRTVSTVAPQALFLLNNPFAHNQARRLAERVLREVPGGGEADGARIAQLFRLLFGRPPTAEETEIARQVLKSSAQDALAGWTDLAHVFLCANEFITID